MSTNPTSQAVILITGCSTGIGRDLAARLTQSGYRVVATARRVDSLAGVPAALKLALDVTDPSSVAQAVAATLERFGRIDGLVNNAGYAQRGAVEEVSDAQMQRMYEVNVFGVLRLVRCVAPILRRQGGGKIINIGSIAGRMATPANGAYSSTKYALEALSDALRLELAPFGVQVVLIEPGSIKTSFVATAEAHAGEMYTNAQSPYRRLYESSRRAAVAQRRNEPGPEVVSQVVEQALAAAHPRSRYLVGVPFPLRLFLHLSDPLRDALLRRIYAIPNIADALGGDE